MWNSVLMCAPRRARITCFSKVSSLRASAILSTRGSHSPVRASELLLYTLHSSLITLHSSFCTHHSTLCTHHSPLYTLHSPLLTLHSCFCFSCSINTCFLCQLKSPRCLLDQHSRCCFQLSQSHVLAILVTCTLSATR